MSFLHHGVCSDYTSYFLLCHQCLLWNKRKNHRYLKNERWLISTTSTNFIARHTLYFKLRTLSLFEKYKRNIDDVRGKRRYSQKTTNGDYSPPLSCLSFSKFETKGGQFIVKVVMPLQLVQKDPQSFVIRIYASPDIHWKYIA